MNSKGYLLAFLVIWLGFWSCRIRPNNSQVKLSDSLPIDLTIPANAKFRSVVRMDFTETIVKPDEARGMYIPACTGAFVGPRTILTSKACFTWYTGYKGTGEYPFIWINKVKFLSQDIKAIYLSEKKEDYMSESLALIVIKQNSMSKLGVDIAQNHFAISFSNHKVGDKVVMVGFGEDDLEQHTGFGVLRKGANTIESVEYGAITFVGFNFPNWGEQPAYSMTGLGDMGSLLLNTNNELIGISIFHSNQGQDSEKSPRRESSYVDLSSNYSKEFLQSVVKVHGFKISGVK